MERKAIMPAWRFECEECDRESGKTVIADQSPINHCPICRCGRRMKPYEISEEPIRSDNSHLNSPSEWHEKDRPIWEAAQKGQPGFVSVQALSQQRLF